VYVRLYHLYIHVFMCTEHNGDVSAASCTAAPLSVFEMTWISSVLPVPSFFNIRIRLPMGGVGGGGHQK